MGLLATRITTSAHRNFNGAQENFLKLIFYLIKYQLVQVEIRADKSNNFPLCKYCSVSSTTTTTIHKMRFVENFQRN